MSLPSAAQAGDMVSIGNQLVATGNAILAALAGSPPPPPVPGGTNVATFLGTDTLTQGNWKGVFGAAGQQIIGDSVSFPAFAVVTATGKNDHPWAASTTDVRALQKAATGRIAACWYGDTFTVDVNLTDGQPHRIALYALDWDGGRSMRIDILDGSKVLDSQTVNGFQNGAYLKWTVQGHVVFKVTKLAGANAVLSGVFID